MRHGSRASIAESRKRRRRRRRKMSEMDLEEAATIVLAATSSFVAADEKILLPRRRVVCGLLLLLLCERARNWRRRRRRQHIITEERRRPSIYLSIQGEEPASQWRLLLLFQRPTLLLHLPLHGTKYARGGGGGVQGRKGMRELCRETQSSKKYLVFGSSVWVFSRCFTFKPLIRTLLNAVPQSGADFSYGVMPQ